MVLNPTLRRRARQFGRLVRQSALTPRSGSIGRPATVHEGDLGVTFIGHSGFLLQFGSRTVLVDPNFAQWIFLLKRLRRPGLRIADLPRVDLVLVTHAHFDHLDRRSLRRVADATWGVCGQAPPIIVPTGVADLVSDLGFRCITELEWWQSQRHDDLDITFVPANHWGARVVTDAHRGFGGYGIRSGRHSVYHAGDTAWFPGFREIGRCLEPQIALLPIGAYYPPSYRAVHATPGDAVRAFLELGAQWMVPMHYGSFRLAHEPLDEPLRLLELEAAFAGVSERVRVLEEGEPWVVQSAVTTPAEA